MDLDELLGRLTGDDQEEKAQPAQMLPLQAEATAMQLRESFAIINKPHSFKVGDLVQWKPGMNNRKFPAYGEPVIVAEVFEPIRNIYADTGTPYFFETVGFRLGHCMPDGDYCEFTHDPRRFEPYTGPGSDSQ